MVYFFVSATSAYLCWRAIGEGDAGDAAGALEVGTVGGDLTSQNNNNIHGAHATATTDGPGSPVPLALRRLQLVVWSMACVVSLVVVALFWFAEVSIEYRVQSSAGINQTVSALDCQSVGVVSRVLYSRRVW